MDEGNRILSLVATTDPSLLPEYSHEVLEELRELESLARDYLQDSIKPSLSDSFIKITGEV